MGYSSLIARAMGDVIRCLVAEREGGEPASDRDDVSASREHDSHRVFRFAPFMTGTTARRCSLALRPHVRQKTEARGAPHNVFFSAAFFILPHVLDFELGLARGSEEIDALAGRRLSLPGPPARSRICKEIWNRPASRLLLGA